MIEGVARTPRELTVNGYGLQGVPESAVMGRLPVINPHRAGSGHGAGSVNQVNEARGANGQGRVFWPISFSRCSAP